LAIDDATKGISSMSKTESRGAGLSEHISAIAHDLMATAMGGFLLPGVVQLWQHFLRHKPPEWATNPIASALAALILIPAFLLTRKTEGCRTVKVTDDAAPSRPQLAPRNEVLALVRKQWVAGVLNQPLYRIARIALGLEESPGAVGRPTELTMSSGGITRPVAPRTSTVSLLDELRGFILLGAPGAGKTMLLAELVRDLVERAQNDLTAPIPVAINLGRWTSERGSIEDWVTAELAGSAPADVIRHWIRNWQIVLVLDALDEVGFDHREACVVAINQFRNDYPSIQIVVSCRSDSYERLTAKLNLHGTVVVCPLTREAIDAAVKHAGEGLKGLRGALEHAPQLYEVLSSPLMLDVARIAYSSPDWRLPAEATARKLQQRLFEKYIDRMLNPELTPGRSSAPRVRKALSWISGNMNLRGHLYFSRDSLTSVSWLPRKLQYRAMRLSSFLVGMRVCFFLATISGAAGYALGSIGSRGLGYGLGIAGALVSVAFGVLLTILSLFIWATYQDRVSDYFDWIYQSNILQSQEALDFRARIESRKESMEESMKESVRDWISRPWLRPIVWFLVWTARSVFWLLPWVKRVLVTTLLVCCILLFPVGGVIGLVLGPLISYILVEIGTQRAMKDFRDGKTQSASYSRRNPNLRMSIAGALCRYVVVGKLMDYIVKWLLWAEQLAPLDHDRLLRIAEDRAILRRTGGNMFSFIHPLLMEHFAQATETGSITHPRIV
jgi:hypothetical protein